VVWLAVYGVREPNRQGTIGVRKGLLGEVGERVDFGGDEQQPGRFPSHGSGLAESWDEEEGEENCSERVRLTESETVVSLFVVCKDSPH